MNGASNYIFQHQGTSLLTRSIPALDPDYFGIDEKKLSDLIVFILDFSKNLVYKNLENKEDGNWQPFFETNIAFVLAQISVTDVEYLKERFKIVTHRIDEELDDREKKVILHQMANYTFELFKIIDVWHKFSRHDLIHIDENKLVEHLQSAITQKLKTQLRSFKLKIEVAKHFYLTESEIDFHFEHFDHLWDSSAFEPLSTLQKDNPISFKRLVMDISVIHKSVLSVIAYLKNISPQLLNQVLEEFPYHSPHSSLVLSFLKLFEHVQEDLNRIMHRHLDYYYGAVLHQSLNPSQPDHVHICFEPSDHIVKTYIPSGTLLAAGTDEDGVEYNYATDHDIEVNHGKITDLKVIHVAKNPLIGISKTYQAVSDIYARQVLMDSEGRPLDNTNNPAPFDTLGKDQSDISFMYREMQQAQIGFAISSAILLLKEGEREISIHYKLNMKSLTSLISFIEEISLQENVSADIAFYKIVNDVFKVRVTAETGWFITSQYAILPPKSWSEGEFQINLSLNISDPAIIGYQEEIHGTGFSTAWPILEFVLSSESAMYAYSYIKDLTIEECRIDVHVREARDLQLFNDLGKLDNNKPFYPFGGTPTVGSYFLLGNEEVVRKNIEELFIDIHWHNLPRVEGGLEAYYKDYKQEIKSDSFTVGITALTEFKFRPASEGNVQQISLFEHDDVKNAISEHLQVSSIDLEKLEIKPNFLQVDLTDYNNKTRSGFIKFEITGPRMGFGFSDYSKLFAEAVIENSKSSSGILSSKEKKVDLPNEPFAPQIRSISFGYSATTTLTMNPAHVARNNKEAKDLIYHIHPFGKQVIFRDGLPTDNHLVAQFDDEGYLIIGIEHIHAPAQLSILFELENNIKNEFVEAKIPTTKWRYLVGNEWRPFEKNELIFDNTNNFTTSGIVQLSLPAVINDQHDIMPSGKFWISVSSDKDTQLFSKISFIKANSVRATWHQHKPGAQWEAHIPAKKISSLVKTLPEISSVHQPFSSFEGRSHESVASYHTRVAERLKHKNRVVTPEDYEKIILDRFPNLFQVKCLSHFSNPTYVNVGYVKIVVVPKLNQTQKFYEPKVSYDQLEEIEDYLRGLSSPFADVEVINPAFERVRITCKVRLQNDKNSGEFVELLKNDIRKFICPWFGEQQREMNFGGVIEKDDVLSFIESMSYVKFVTKLSVVVLHYRDGRYSLSDSANAFGSTSISSSTPWSVLVSDPDQDFLLVDKSISEAPEHTRIETMKIGTNFVIAEEDNVDIDFPVFDLEKDTYYSIEIDL